MRIPCDMNLRPARRSHWSSAGLGEILYRSITRDYRNDTYYTKGLLSCWVVVTFPEAPIFGKDYNLFMRIQITTLLRGWRGIRRFSRR